MKKIFTFGAIALALVLGFASCDKNEDQPIDLGQKGGDTYVGLSIKFPTANPVFKATQDENYNPVEGSWQGRDDLQSITVYLVTKDKAVTSEYFTKKDFDGIDENGVLLPRLALEAVSGDEVSAYVVINDVNKVITGALGTAGWPLGSMVENGTKPTTDFATAFNKAIQLTSVSQVATYTADASGIKDVIMMTNEKEPNPTNGGTITVDANVTIDQAKQGVNNQIKVNVARVASRAMVTIAKDAKKEIDVKRTNISTGNTETTSKVKITKVRYAATGSSIQLNPIQPTDLKAPKGIYDFVPNTTYWTDFTGTNGTDAAGTTVTDSKKLFSYADSYSLVATMEEYTPKDSEITAALEAESTSKFLLPITHESNNYKKGNTAFFTIRAEFDAYNMVDGAETLVEPTEADGSVYLGKTDGKFYTTADRAMMKDENFLGTADSDNALQQFVKYTGGVMFYNIWINPNKGYDQTEELITESPVYRNQVYHAHITGFKEIGLNWSPNNDPDNPKDPKEPTDPEDPFKPEDPLETQKTYLSVQLKVLNYSIHSYTVDLGNRY
ncbi:MAG: Mfa1 family fimbria major subunit [Fermentimonas sp.]|jgi:hypothetical protein